MRGIPSDCASRVPRPLNRGRLQLKRAISLRNARDAPATYRPEHRSLYLAARMSGVSALSGALRRRGITGAKPRAGVVGNFGRKRARKAQQTSANPSPIVAKTNRSGARAAPLCHELSYNRRCSSESEPLGQLPAEIPSTPYRGRPELTHPARKADSSACAARREGRRTRRMGDSPTRGGGARAKATLELLAQHVALEKSAPHLGRKVSGKLAWEITAGILRDNTWGITKWASGKQRSGLKVGRSGHKAGAMPCAATPHATDSWQQHGGHKAKMPDNGPAAQDQRGAEEGRVRAPEPPAQGLGGRCTGCRKTPQPLGPVQNRIIGLGVN